MSHYATFTQFGAALSYARVWAQLEYSAHITSEHGRKFVVRVQWFPSR